MCVHPCRASNADLAQGIDDYNTGKYQSSANHLNAALPFDFNNAVLHYYLANAYVHLHKNNDAIREFRITYAIQPEGDAGKMSRQALVYMGAEPDDQAKKPVEPPKGPSIDPGVEKTLNQLSKQADYNAGLRTTQGQIQASEASRRGKDDVTRKTNGLLDDLRYSFRYGRPHYDPNPQLPHDAQEQMDRLRKTYEDHQSNLVKESQKQAHELQKSAETLKSQLMDPKANPEHIHLVPDGTNLYVRHYKPDQAAAKEQESK